MARYIDLDKAIERISVSPAFPNMGMDGYFLRDVVCDLLKKQPTADVVPKSEVENAEAEIERLKHILNCYALQYGTVTEQQKVIDDAKSEVAREIFEEIEKLLKSQEAVTENQRLKEVADWIFQDYLPRKVAELKKKYTEDKV